MLARRRFFCPRLTVVVTLYKEKGEKTESTRKDLTAQLSRAAVTKRGARPDANSRTRLLPLPTPPR